MLWLLRMAEPMMVMVMVMVMVKDFKRFLAAAATGDKWKHVAAIGRTRDDDAS